MTEAPAKEAQANEPEATLPVAAASETTPPVIAEPEATPPDTIEVEAPPPVSSSGVPVILVCVAALTVIGAATANFLPSVGGLSLAYFRHLSLPDADFSLPDFSRFTPPNTARVAVAMPPPPPPPVLVPDPVVRAGLRDIQTTQQQDTETLAALTQSSTAQQADLKRITRQLALLTAQVSSLQNQVSGPLTTSSLPLPTIPAVIPRPNPRARVVRASRRVVPPVLPPISPPAVVAPSLKPEGPFSVGGAPLSPAPIPGSAS